MKTLIITLILLAAVSSAEEIQYSRHSVSLSIVPFYPLFLIPDLGYEYSFTSNDALGLYTVAGFANRLVYSRKLGNFRLAGGLGFVFEDAEYDNATIFTTVTGEHHINLGEHYYTRTVLGAAFSKEYLDEIPFFPIFQLGLGCRF